MIYLEKFNITIKVPEDINTLEVSVKNYLYEKLAKGLVLFLIPEDLENTDFPDEKKIKKNYKVGFLNEALKIVYPLKNNNDVCNVISEKFHLWFTYRQYFTIIKQYEKDRKKYLFQRNLLFK